jgi:Flp pilus assembly pilin Flp
MYEKNELAVEQVRCDAGREAGLPVRGQAVTRGLRGAMARANAALTARACTARARLAVLRDEEEGQGTTEYAILVGVLVVIAIVAIAAFRGRIQSLWDEISNAINGL